MKLTVIVSETGAACNIGGPVTFRRITVDLTEEQATALRLTNRWDSYGTTFLEFDSPDLVCRCPTPLAQHNAPTKCHFCGKDLRPYAREQPCGCIVCTCKTNDRCLGCGGKNCGTPECVFKFGTPVYVEASRA